MTLQDSAEVTGGYFGLEVRSLCNFQSDAGAYHGLSRGTCTVRIYEE